MLAKYSWAPGLLQSVANTTKWHSIKENQFSLASGYQLQIGSWLGLRCIYKEWYCCLLEEACRHYLREGHELLWWSQVSESQNYSMGTIPSPLSLFPLPPPPLSVCVCLCVHLLVKCSSSQNMSWNNNFNTTLRTWQFLYGYRPHLKPSEPETIMAKTIVNSPPGDSDTYNF